MARKTPRFIGLAAIATSLATSGWMYARVQDGQLWGYAPLLLYLSLYLGCWLLLTFRKEGPARISNHYSASAGLLLGLGFPGIIPFPFLLLIAFVPLVYLQKRLALAEASNWKVFGHGFSAFVLYNLLSTYWVTNTGFFAGLFAILVNSVLMALPWLFFHWTAKRSPSIGYLAFASAWMSFEFLHYNWSLNWPWLTLGNGFMQFPEIVQWYEYTGVFGGTAWILGVNYLAARIFPAFFPDIAPAAAQEKAIQRQPIALIALVLLPIVGSLIRYFTYAPPAGDTITVVAVQPNFEPHFEKFSGNRNAQIDTFLQISNAALAAGPADYLIYPETSFSNIEENQVTRAPAIKVLMGEFSEKGLGHLVTGIDAYHIFAEGETYSENVRFFDRGRNGTLALEAINGAAQIDIATGDFQTYRKSIFVPGAESFPFKKALFFLEPFVNSLGGTVAGRAPQVKRTPLTSDVAKVAPVICYESVFGEYFTGYVREGAQAIFVMTNDGWWDNTAGHRQHLWLSSLRAIETRREVVRSANVGACAFIDQRGAIRSRTKYDEAGFLRGEMRLNDRVTLYVRFGDALARIALLIFAMITLTNVARTLRPRAFSPDEA